MCEPVELQIPEAGHHPANPVLHTVEWLRRLADCLEYAGEPQRPVQLPDLLELTYSDWASVERDTHHGLDELAGPADVVFRGRCEASLAVLAALCGESEQAAVAIGRSQLLSATDGVAARSRDLARGLVALTDGDTATAISTFRGLLASPNTPERSALAAVGWLVEAASRTGQISELATILHTASPGDGSLLAERELAFAHAVIECELSGPEALRSLLSSTESERGPMPNFYLARVQFTLGRALRHRRRVSEARPFLVSAAGIFTELGSRHWAENANSELAATAPNRRSGFDTAQLTARELQVARLAADGLTNREIGQRLVISSRTVGHHLANVFPKLGIATRAQLARRVDALAVEAAHQYAS